MALTKKTFFLLLISVSFVMSGQRLGITIGSGYNTQVKSAKQIAPISYAYYNRLSPLLGLIYRDSINRFLTFRSGVYYVQRGVRFKYNYDTQFYYLRTDQTFTCHYISFPIRLNFNYRNFFIGGGVEGSILIKGRYHTIYEERDPTSGYENKNIIDKYYGWDIFNPVDAGFNFNVGYKLKRFEIEASVFHGLMSPAKFFVFGIQHFEYKYATQQTFMLSVNYYFKKQIKK